MTDEIDARKGSDSPDDEDPAFDPASEDETKVVLESLEPQKHSEPVTPLATEKTTESASAPVTARTNKMKNSQETAKKADGCGSSFCLFKAPLRAFQAYRGIRSARTRWSIAFGVGLAIGAGVFVFWPSRAPEVVAEPRLETCEFLARPAARLYIDGNLASEEVPPIHRTQLEIGEHTVRFVSPENRAHEASILIVRGRPTQWFMNFVSDTLDERSLISEREDK